MPIWVYPKQHLGLFERIERLGHGLRVDIECGGEFAYADRIGTGDSIEQLTDLAQRWLIKSIELGNVLVDDILNEPLYLLVNKLLI